MEQLEIIGGLAFWAALVLLIVGGIKTRNEMKSMEAEAVNAMTPSERKAAKKKTTGRKYTKAGWALFGVVIVLVIVDAAAANQAEKDASAAIQQGEHAERWLIEAHADGTDEAVEHEHG